MPQHKTITHINSYFVLSPVHRALVEQLDANGLSQQIFVPVQKREFMNKNRPSFLQKGQVHYVHCFNTLHRYLWPVKLWRIWKAFKKHHARHPAKWIHAHTLMVNGFIALWAHKKWGASYVISIRYTDFHFFLEKAFFLKPLARRILKHASKIVFLSPAYMNTQVARFFSKSDYRMILAKSVVIPNGINDFWIKNRQPKEERTKKRRVLFVGSLDARKNIKGLLGACDKLNEEGFEVELDIVGDGPFASAIRKQQRLTPVVLHGHVSDPHVLLGIYRQADLLAVPSFIETFGLVYPEAMTQGLPVIYSRDQGFDGYFPDGTVGFAIDPKQIPDIADKIKKVYENYQNISSNAFQASRLFSHKNASDKLMEVYSHL